MKHAYLWGGLGVLIIGFVLLSLFGVDDRMSNVTVAPLLGDEVLVTIFTSDGTPTGKVLVQVPFLRNYERVGDIEIAVDRNGDARYKEGEILVHSMPVVGTKGWRSGYYAPSDAPIEQGTLMRISVDNSVHEATASVREIETRGLLDLESITDPENAMKGIGVGIAHAETDIELSYEGIPDLNQRKGECAPTAAANSLISLVDRYGGEDLIPGDPQDFIENLKRHMNWTPENGVLPDDFVEGKNRWAAAAGVPIRTKKIGDEHGLTTVQDIRTALENGDAVEMRIKFADAAAAKIVGGHMVTVVGIHEDAGQTYLEINDPYTKDSGTEMVEIRQNQIVNYGPWEHITIVSWGFVQTWEGHPTGALLDTMTDEEIIGIRQFAGDTPMLTVIEYNGKYLPTSQLAVQNEVGCGEDHWHAARGNAVTATDGTTVPDPGPQCGYGTLSERPAMEIEAPDRND